MNAASPGVNHTLAERWNGAAWQIQPTPDRGLTGRRALGSSLAAVSCTSATACTAVGAFAVGSKVARGSQQFRTLAERWNGTAWKIQPTPNPAGAFASGLGGVSCTSATACTAVGFFDSTSGSELTLAERWNGAVWTIQTTPNPADSTVTELTGVSCTSAAACTAVGSNNLAERWDGTAWAIQPTANPGGATSLNGVSCSSAASCTVVGEGGVTGLDPVAEQWNGTTWAVLPTPGPTGALDTNLTSVSCLSAGHCTAVGLTAPFTPGPPVVVVERWNGTAWVVQNAPSPNGATSSILEGVSCASATACTAVGDFSNPAGDELTLAEHS